MSRRHDALADRAYRVVRNLERDTFHMVRATLTQPWRYARTVVDLDDVCSTQQEFNERLARILSARELSIITALQGPSTTYAEDLIQLARWQRHGTIYAVHPATLSALVDTDWGKTRIPGEVLSRIPHPDPIVVLPEPIRWPNDEGQFETYEAFGVFGVRNQRRRSSSASEDVTHLALHFFGRVTDEAGRPIPYPFPDLNSPGTVRNVNQVLGCRSVVDISTDATMEERQRYAITDMLEGGPTALVGFRDLDDAASGMATLTRIGLAILTYIASDNLDIERRGASPGATRNRGRSADPSESETSVTTYALGYRVGAALISARRESTAESHSPDSGRTVTPHVRRAHLHTFRRGPGHSERFVKWLPPIAVNTDNPRRAMPTVHHVN
jgi:hypothetical protein